MLRNLSWKEPDVHASLATLCAYVEDEAQRQIDWYHAKRRVKASISTALRFAAILMFVLGGLVPIVKAALVPQAIQRIGFDFGQTGYLLLAVAGGCVAMDRFFGYSSGWIRYITTALALEKSLQVFRLDWARHTARLRGGPPDEAQLDQLITACEIFSLSVRGQIEQETKAWVIEFENNLSRLERDLESKAEEFKKMRSAGLKPLTQSVP